MGQQQRLKREKRRLREQKRQLDPYANLEDCVRNEITEAHLIENRGRTLFILSGIAQSTAMFAEMVKEAAMLKEGPAEYFSHNYGFLAVAASVGVYLYLQLQMRSHLQKVQEQGKVALKTDKAWAYCRNPIYLSMRNMSASIFAAAPSIASAVASAGVFLGTEIAARAEERKLEAYFQDIYRAYKVRVPRWIPRLYR